MSHSPDVFEYQSTRRVTSSSWGGVQFEIRRMSLRGRSELARELMQLTPRLEFAAAGASPMDQLEATKLIAEVSGIYLRWGLVRVEGLNIDGDAVTAESLMERGPEELCEEITNEIRRECGLSQDERKN